MSDCCPGCLTQADSLIAAIEGNDAGMKYSDLILACKMLCNSRDAWRKDFEAERGKVKEFWGILVMLKRELDDHVSNPSRYELPKDAWEEAAKRAELMNPFSAQPVA